MSSEGDSGSTPMHAPKPRPNPSGKGRLILPLLIVLALVAPVGYYLYSGRFRNAPAEEAAIPEPAPGEEPPPSLPPFEPPVSATSPATPLKPPLGATAEQNFPVRPAKKPALRVEDSVAPQPSENPSPQAAIPSPQPPAAASGIMLWSGKVEKNGTIVIDGGKSSSGTVNGAVLPGVPVIARVEPKGFTISEPPSAATGWKRIAIHSAKKAHIVVTIVWNTRSR